MLPQAQLQSLCKILDNKISQGYRYLRSDQLPILNGAVVVIYLQLPTDIDTLFIIRIYPRGDTNEFQA